MATGVGAAVGILGKILQISTESSGHFKASAKLLDTGMRMIFRPMGDAIGLVLRPFALMMIKWAIPFYENYDGFLNKTTVGGEQVAEGDIFKGSKNIRDAIVEAITGSENEIGYAILKGIFGNIFTVIGDFQVLGEPVWKSLSDWWTENISSLFTIPSAYADGTDDPTGIISLGKDIDIFGGIIKDVQEEIRKRMTLDGLGIEPGSDFTNTSQNKSRSNRGNKGIGTGSKTITKEEFLNLRKILGTTGAKKYMEDSGFEIGTSSTRSDTGRGSARGGGGNQGVNININTLRMEDPDLGRKIQTELQKELKKLPGHR